VCFCSSVVRKFYYTKIIESCDWHVVWQNIIVERLKTEGSASMHLYFVVEPFHGLLFNCVVIRALSVMQKRNITNANNTLELLLRARYNGGVMDWIDRNCSLTSEVVWRQTVIHSQVCTGVINVPVTKQFTYPHVASVHLITTDRLIADWLSDSSSSSSLISFDVQSVTYRQIHGASLLQPVAATIAAVVAAISRSNVFSACYGALTHRWEAWSVGRLPQGCN